MVWAEHGSFAARGLAALKQNLEESLPLRVLLVSSTLGSHGVSEFNSAY